METRWLIPLGILLVLLASGCTTDMVEKFLKDYPEMQDFIDKYPGTTVKAVYLDGQAVASRIDYIRADCGDQMEVVPYYFIVLTTPSKGNNYTINTYLDPGSNDIICIMNKVTYANGTTVTTQNNEVGVLASYGTGSTNPAGIVELDIMGKVYKFRFINESDGTPILGLFVSYALNQEKTAGVILAVDPVDPTYRGFPPQIIVLKGTGEASTQSNGITGHLLLEGTDDDNEINDFFIEKGTSIIKQIGIEKLKKLAGPLPDIGSLTMLAAKVMDQFSVPTGVYFHQLGIASQRTITVEEAQKEVSLKNRIGEKLTFANMEEAIETKGMSLELKPADLMLDLLHFVVDKNAVSVCGLPGERIQVTEIKELPAIYSCKQTYIGDYIPMQLSANVNGMDERGLPLDPTKSSLSFFSKGRLGLAYDTKFDKNGRASAEVPKGNYLAKINSPGFAPAYKDMDENNNEFDATLDAVKMPAVPGGRLMFFTQNMPSVIQNKAYKYSLCRPALGGTNDVCGESDTTNPTGGNPSYTFNLVGLDGESEGDRIPNGLRLYPNGIISGSATDLVGTYCFGVEVTDQLYETGTIKACIEVTAPQAPRPPSGGNGQCSGAEGSNKCAACSSNADCGGARCYTSMLPAPFC